MKAPKIDYGPVTHVDGETKSLVWWIWCPSCQVRGMADTDQMRGRVSIVCECGYHETHELVDEDFKIMANK